MPKAMQNVTNVLPLTQGIKLLKGFSLGLEQENMIFALCLLVVIAVASILISIKFFRWE